MDLLHYYNVSSLRNNLIKLTRYAETKKMAHNSDIGAKENLKLNRLVWNIKLNDLSSAIFVTSIVKILESHVIIHIT